jgi:SAM-dependent methyltransferase
MRSFYDYPALYDAIHLPDTPAEMAGMLAAARRHRARLSDLLEPACGTGRNLRFLSELAYAVAGYDTSARALAFARRRGLRVARASMTDHRADSAFDAAYSLIGTFRHLPHDRDALRHLRLTAAALRPGGVYVIGLDLVDYDDCPPDEEGWEVIRRGRRLRHLYETLPPRRRLRCERVINFITVETRGGDRVLQDETRLRSYDLPQWRALIARSPFRLAGAATANGAPLRLSRRTRYALFVLKKK